MRRISFFLTPLLAALALPQAAGAVAVTVNRFDDGSTTPGHCTMAPFDCTLRAAVTAVENDPTIDRTITIPPGFYPLSTYILLGDLTLAGSDALTTIIDAAFASDRAFVIFPNTTVTITGVTIAHGRALDSGSKGGAINNSNGTLTLTDCIVRDSQAEAAGGGISSNGPLTLIRTEVSGNTAGFYGGGINNEGSTLTVIDSTIDGNHSFTNSTNGPGGGIFNGYGTAVLSGCTISNNQSGSSGGGLSNFGGTMTLTNCTVSGNMANPKFGSPAGGIEAEELGLVTLNNVTVTDNMGTFGGGVGAGTSGLNVQNSIIAGNHDPMGGSSDCQGTITSLGYDLIGNAAGCTINGSSANLTGLDPLLGPLADNGGPTKTHALLPGSPAIDAANPAAPASGTRACADMDQRGIARPQPADGRCDIGAFELALPPTTTTTSRPPNTATTVTTTSTTRPSPTTTAPTPSTTSTTLPSGCVLDQLPEDSFPGVECAITTVRATLNGPPQPDCTGRCKCSPLETPIDHIDSLASQAQGASSAKKCKRKLNRARRAAKSFNTRISSLLKRHCIAPTNLGTTLAQETANLTIRSKALFKSGYCAGK